MLQRHPPGQSTHARIIKLTQRGEAERNKHSQNETKQFPHPTLAEFTRLEEQEQPIKNTLQSFQSYFTFIILA